MDLTQGAVGDYPAHSDLDGDGRTDLVLVHNDGTRLIWNIRFSASGETRSIAFGKSGDTVISNCNFLGTRSNLAVLTPAGTLRYRTLEGSKQRLRIGAGVGSIERSSCIDFDGDGKDELLLQLSNFDVASQSRQSRRARVKTLSARGGAALVAINMHAEILFTQALRRARAIIEIVGLDIHSESRERPGILQRTASGERLTLFGEDGTRPFTFDLTSDDQVMAITTARLQDASEIENGLYVFREKQGLEQLNFASFQVQLLLAPVDIPPGSTMLKARSSNKTGL